MFRIKFQKGKQRKFIQEVLEKINCPSLKELSNRLGVNYSTLKNYFNEERLLPENLFSDLCYVSKINEGNLDIEFLEENWGKIKGGKKEGGNLVRFKQFQYNPRSKNER